jgi:hypothetical protein
LLGLDNSLGGDLDSSASDRDRFRSPEELVVVDEATAATTVTEFPFIGLLTGAEDGGERDCCCCCCSEDDSTLLVLLLLVVDSLLSPPLSLQSDG